MSHPELRLSRPGLPGDIWSWLDVFVEDHVLPHVGPRDQARRVDLRLECSERLVDPELHRAFRRTLEASGSSEEATREYCRVEHQVESEVRTLVSEHWSPEVAHCVRSVVGGGDVVLARTFTSGAPRNTHILFLPPAEFLTSLANVYLASALYPSSEHSMEDICRHLVPFQKFSPAQQEIVLGLVHDGMDLEEALEAALLV